MSNKNKHNIAGTLRTGSKAMKCTLVTFFTLLFFVVTHFVLSPYIYVSRPRNFAKSAGVNKINKTYSLKISSKAPYRNDSLVAKMNRMFDVKLKQGLMTLINPTSPKYALTVNGSYHLENKDFCSDEKYLTLLVMVLSATNNFQRRNYVRETWGNSSYYLKHGAVKVIFLLGLTKDSRAQQHIVDEFKHSRDILQGSFIDSYRNLSYKSVLGFKWLTERCRNAKYIIKTDDDVVVNIFHIFENVIPKLSLDQYHVHCQRMDKSAVIRQRTAKAYVEPHQLRGMKNHMPYCHGQYVMFLNDIVPYLYKSAAITPFFWIDDVFNYGIVMNNIPGLKYSQVHPSEYISYQKMKRPLCFTQKSPLCRYLYVVGDHENQLRTIWSSLKLQY